MKFLSSLKFLLIGVGAALVFGSLLVFCVGESPKVLFEALYNSLFTPFGLGYSLFYATPLIFTGLAVAVSFHAGLFNIGAEGQLYFGSLSVMALAILFPGLPWWAALPLSVLSASLGGAIVGGFAGFLKAKRGSHEVIVTILLNFISIAIVDYCILFLFRNRDTQNPETVAVGVGYQLPTLSEFTLFDSLKSTPVNLSLVLAIGLALLVWLFLQKTARGFELRACGENPEASRFAGMSVTKNYFLALALSGALAGLVGINEICGHEHKLIQGFSPQYGFTGIAVALLARNHPIAILFSALVFGTLQNSSRELEFLSNKLSKEISMVLQAILVAFIASRALFEERAKKKAISHG